VQVDVGQQGRNHSALRRPGGRDAIGPILQDARVEPFADQTEQHPVAYPPLKKLPQLGMIQRVERSSNMIPPSTTHPRSPKKSR
jgi:hypothetical protein